MEVFYLTLAIATVVVGLTVKTFRSTSWKGYCLYDSFFIGATIYFLGMLLVGYSTESSDVDQLLIISAAYYSVTFLLWAINRFSGTTMINIDLFKEVRSRNTFFLIMSIILVLVVNSIFSYLVYSRVIQGQGLYKLLDIRKTIASGEAGYMFPGGVKQIRDIYGIALIFWLSSFYKGTGRKYILTLVTTVIIASMILSGQRTAILIVMLSLGLSLYLKAKINGTKIGSGAKVLFIAPPVIILYVITMLLGRTNPDDTPLESFSNFVWSTFYRVFATVPHENVSIMPFLRDYNPELFALWISDLAILLPGKQVSISSAMHQYLGGSSQGNSVLGAPLDIYINSGYLGLFIVPIISLLFLNFLQKGLLKQKNPFSISILVVLIFYIPFCYSFYMLLLNGGLLAVIYLMYSYLVPRKISFRNGRI
jgi:oligosaccharide repeat unit polymerase